LENIIVWGGIITMNLLFVFISPILDSLSDNENREKLEKKWLKAFIIILIVSKIITYYINEYEIDSQLIFDFINGNLKFLFNKGENPIISLIEIIVNISQSLEIYLGVISVLVAIYIYSISLGDDFKKYVLLTLLGEGKVLYLTVFLLVLYFFNISPVLFITLSIVIFYELYRMIRETFKIMNTVYFKENWKDKIIPQLMKENNRRNLENIYFELRKRIIKAMLERDFIVFEEMIFYYKTLLMTDGFEAPEDFIENKVQNQENEKAVRFLYNLYVYLLKEKDNNLFRKISYLNIELGRYYLKRNNFELAKAYYGFLNSKYDYYSKDDNLKYKGIYIFEGIKGYRDFFNHLSLEQEIIILKSILNLFMRFLKENKIEEIQKYKKILFEKKGKLNYYLVIVLTYFLEKLENKDEKLIKEFKQKFLIGRKISLEEIYALNQDEKLEEKFDISDYLMEIDENFGNGAGSFGSNLIGIEILRIMNEVNPYISKEFFKKNKVDIENIVREYKLENLSKRIKILENEN